VSRIGSVRAVQKMRAGTLGGQSRVAQPIAFPLAPRQQKKKPVVILHPGALIWLEASLGVPALPPTVTNVTAWQDQTANNRDQQGGIVQTGRTVGGRAALDFVPVSFVTVQLNTADTSHTAYFVAQVDALSSFQTLLGGFNAVGNPYLQYRIDQTTGKLTCNRQQTSGVFTTSGAVAAATPFVISIAMTPTTWRVRINHNAAETGAHSATFFVPPIPSEAVNLGGSTGGFEPLDGAIAEFIWYDSTKSTTDQDDEHNALLAKYGI
jgi:hypothetical protein